MLKRTEITNPHSIEENVCLKIREITLSVKEREPDTETLMLLLKLLGAKPICNIPEKEKPFLWKMIEGRLGCYEFTINDDRLILLLIQIAKTPGNVVMLLWYLQWWYLKQKQEVLTLELFTMDIFPMGFPSQANLEVIWDNQKVERSNPTDSDNLVDYHSAGESLRFVN